MSVATASGALLAAHAINSAATATPDPPASPPTLLASPRPWHPKPGAQQALRDWLTPTEAVRVEPISRSEDFLDLLNERESASALRSIRESRSFVISGEFEQIDGWRWRALLLRRGNPRLLIVHAGHGQNPFQGELISRALSSGYDVLAMSMPMVGWNAMGRVEVDTWDGRSQLLAPRDHGALEMLDTGDKHFIGFFISPVIASIDAAGPYDQIEMTGLSGGGWTTVIATAAEPRISRAVSVAGSLPFYARQQPKDLGDSEQHDREFYRRFPWPMLYAMAGDRLRLVYNAEDPCCFDGASAGVLRAAGQPTILTRRDTHSLDAGLVLSLLE